MCKLLTTASPSVSGGQDNTSMSNNKQVVGWNSTFRPLGFCTSCLKAPVSFLFLHLEIGEMILNEMPFHFGSSSSSAISTSLLEERTPEGHRTLDLSITTVQVIPNYLVIHYPVATFSFSTSDDI